MFLKALGKNYNRLWKSRTQRTFSQFCRKQKHRNIHDDRVQTLRWAPGQVQPATHSTGIVWFGFTCWGVWRHLSPIWLWWYTCSGSQTYLNWLSPHLHSILSGSGLNDTSAPRFPSNKFSSQVSKSEKHALIWPRGFNLHSQWCGNR